MAKQNIERTHYTPPVAAEKIGCSPDTIVAFIRSGELKASNLSRGSQRPRWRISKVDLQDFLDRRSNHPAEPKRRRRRSTRTVAQYV